MLLYRLFLFLYRYKSMLLDTCLNSPSLYLLDQRPFLSISRIKKCSSSINRTPGPFRWRAKHLERTFGLYENESVIVVRTIVLKTLPIDDSFTRTLMIMRNNPTFDFFFQIGHVLHRHRSAILFWIYLMAIMAYAYRWVEY